MSTATVERLAQHLYRSALDLGPEPIAAMRISGNVSWSIDSGVMDIVFGDGRTLTVMLTGTVGTLRKALTSAGLIIDYVNTETLNLSAKAIVDGSGDGGNSATGVVNVFSSNLWTLLGAYGIEVDAAETQVEEAIKQLYIGSAEGELLDYWGEHFGVLREGGELDADYRVRIIVEVLRPKNNKIALENAASALVGDRVEIHEPWTDLFHLSDSRLDQERMYDGDIWSPYVFRPVYRGDNNIQWDKVIALLDRLRPAGVFQLSPEWVPSARGQDASVHSLGLISLDTVFGEAVYPDKMVLDNYHFGDEVVSNYRVVAFDVFGHTNDEGVPDPLIALSTRKTFVMAEVILSEQATLGSLRCRTTMNAQYSYDRLILDGIPLSNYDPLWNSLAVEDVSWPSSIRGAEAGYTPSCGLTPGRTDAAFAEASTSFVGDVAVIEVVTAIWLQAGFNYLEGSAPLGWFGPWDGNTWNTYGAISGIAIKVTTENA